MFGEWFRALFRRVPVIAPNGLEFAIRLSPNANERMGKLMKKLGTKDRADIVRDALRVFEYVVDSELSGVEFYAKKTGHHFPQLHDFLKKEDEEDLPDDPA